MKKVVKKAAAPKKEHIHSVGSYAGSHARYNEDDRLSGFRMRTDGGSVRIHINRGLLKKGVNALTMRPVLFKALLKKTVGAAKADAETLKAYTKAGLRLNKVGLNVRLALPKSQVRERETYIATDIPAGAMVALAAKLGK